MTVAGIFLELPLEIRHAIYRAYFSSWSCSLAIASPAEDPTNLGVDAIRLKLDYSPRLLLVCKQVQREIRYFDCIRASYSGELACTDHVSLHSYEFFRYHWVFRDTTILFHSHLGLLSSPEWHPISVMPALRQIVIENGKDWSSTLSLETGVQDAAAILRSKQLPSHALCRQEDFKKLESISSNNNINIIIRTILKVKDRCNFNALPIVRCLGIGYRIGLTTC